MNNKIIFLWLAVLTGLYFYWPMCESESIRAEIDRFRDRYRQHRHYYQGKVFYGTDENGLDPYENKKYEKKGVWMRRKHVFPELGQGE